MADLKIGKEIQNRLTTSSNMAESSKQNAELVGTGAQDFFGETLDLPSGSLVKLVTACSLRLFSDGENLNEAEKKYIAELSDDVLPRAERDMYDTHSRNLMYAIRFAIKGAFGDVGLTTYGLSKPIPKGVKQLASRMESVIDLLTKNPAVKKDILENEVDTTKLAAKLKVAHENLTNQLKRLRAEEKQRQRAINDRDRALEKWTDTYEGIGHVLTGLFLLAGREELAEQLRPTVRKTSGKDVVEIEEPAVDDDPTIPDDSPVSP